MLIKSKYQSKRVTFRIVDDLVEKTKVPTLVMQINPNTFKQGFNKKINRSTTLSAFIEEHWGEDLDSINCTGTTGAFYLDNNGGLTAIYKSYTEPYFKLQDICDLYRNNGCFYRQDGMVVRVGYVELEFDEGIYRGYFENFNWIEDASSPFRLTFDFSFKVETKAMVL